MRIYQVLWNRKPCTVAVSLPYQKAESYKEKDNRYAQNTIFQFLWEWQLKFSEGQTQNGKENHVFLPCKDLEMKDTVTLVGVIDFWLIFIFKQTRIRFI